MNGLEELQGKVSEIDFLDFKKALTLPKFGDNVESTNFI